MTEQATLTETTYYQVYWTGYDRLDEHERATLIEDDTPNGGYGPFGRYGGAGLVHGTYCATREGAEKLAKPHYGGEVREIKRQHAAPVPVDQLPSWRRREVHCSEADAVAWHYPQPHETVKIYYRQGKVLHGIRTVSWDDGTGAEQTWNALECWQFLAAHVCGQHCGG